MFIKIGPFFLYILISLRSGGGEEAQIPKTSGRDRKDVGRAEEMVSVGSRLLQSFSSLNLLLRFILINSKK